MIIGAVAIGMIFVLGILAAILLPALAGGREAARRASCSNNLKQMGIVYKIFASENQGSYFPELSSEPGQLMFGLSESSDSRSVYPEYLTALSVLICPSDPDGYPEGGLLTPEWAIDDNSYFYFGYAVTNDAEMAAFAQAYQSHLATGEPFLTDLPVPAGSGTVGTDKIYRLREMLDELIMTESDNQTRLMQRDIPVMIDRPDHHVPGGGNVLYMDGHVEYRKYGEWPMTDETLGLLYALDALGE